LKLAVANSDRRESDARMPDAPQSTPAPSSIAAPVIVASPHPIIVARADSMYRWKRFALVAVLFVYGLYSLYDGFYHYPRDNAAARAKGWDPPHPALDVPLNQSLGVLLPPLSLLLLAWSLHASRGQIRFDGATLEIPGHPTIPLNALRKMDRSKWERKGIAVFDYQLPGTTTAGTFKLDDFVYQRKPTDQIFTALEAAITAAAGAPAVGPASSSTQPG
jgi:hypothetical protein